jgi:hypothetical protein
MHHHFSTYYELDKKMREQDVQRAIDHNNQIKMAKSRLPKRRPRWQTFIAMLIGFFF